MCLPWKPIHYRLDERSVLACFHYVVDEFTRWSFNNKPSWQWCIVNLLNRFRINVLFYFERVVLIVNFWRDLFLGNTVKHSTLCFTCWDFGIFNISFFWWNLTYIITVYFHWENSSPVFSCQVIKEVYQVLEKSCSFIGSSFAWWIDPGREGNTYWWIPCIK